MKEASHLRTRVTFLGVLAGLGRGMASGVEDVNDAWEKLREEIYSVS